MMKSIGYLILAALTFFSCSKEDEDTLAGTYKMDSLKASNCSNALMLEFGDNGCVTWNGLEYCQEGSLSLSANGAATSSLKLTNSILGTVWSLNGTGTYVRNGSNLTICFTICEDFKIASGRLTLSGNSAGCLTEISLKRI